MKKLVSIIIISFAHFAQAQTVVPVLTKSKNPEVTTQMSLSGKIVKKVSTDSLLAENSATSLASERAVKGYVVIASNSISVKKYGAKGNGTTNDAAAIQAAINAGGRIFFPNGVYKVDTTITINTKVYIFGDTKATIKRDGTIFNVQHDSVTITSLNFINSNVPYLIKRDSSNWGKYPTFPHNNGPGYMPTVNDAMYDSLPSTYKSQTIGCNIYSGNINALELSYLTGNFLQIFLQGAAYSKIHDCNFRAGGYGIAMWNNCAQAGLSNEVYNNTIRYASLCGIVLISNNRSSIHDNCIYNCGESGIKTWQNSIAGVDARCSKTVITNNSIAHCAYDGIDATVNYSYDTLNDNAVRVLNNSVLNCAGNGINVDGIGPTVQNNRVEQCRQSGIFSRSRNSFITGNSLFDNNTGNFASGVHEITEDGGLNNVITGNLIRRRTVHNGYGIYIGIATKRAVVANNVTLNATVQDVGTYTVKVNNN